MFDKQKFKASVVLSGMSMNEIADKMGINVATLYRKISRNGDFSREEIQKLKEILNIINPNEIFFA